MGRYTLVALNKNNGRKYNINIKNLSTDAPVKFNLSEIDAFTSRFETLFDFTSYLNKENVIDFNDVSYCITYQQDGRTKYLRVIFNSEMITQMAQTVNASNVNSSMKGYNDSLNFFYNTIKDDKKFNESINNAVTIPVYIKNLMFQYIQAIADAEDAMQQIRLKLRINEELKRYKNFRGFYLFMEEYKEKGYVARRETRYYNEEEIELEEQTTEENSKQNSTNSIIIKKPEVEEKKDIVIDSVDKHNKENEDFWTEEEFEAAYGKGNAYHI